MAAQRTACSLSCSVCLEVLRKPVTLPCGHSYCMDCVSDYWDLEDQKGVCSCPQCRHTFNSRPVLNKNTVLVDLIENMAEPERTTPLCEKQAKPNEVECDFCTARKLKAVKTCLVCLASYCATHVQPHYESAAFQRHKLVEVSGSIQEKICSKHDKLLEVYCRSDDECICLLCVMDEHKGHDTVSAAAARKEKQKLFGEKKQRNQQRIGEKAKQVRQLGQKMKALKLSRDAALDQNEKIYAEIVSMADKRRSVVKELIEHQENAAFGQTETLIGQLEKEIRDLRGREDDLRRLSSTEDNIYFLQHCKRIFNGTEPEVSLNINLQQCLAFDCVTKAISDLKDKMEMLSTAIKKISNTIETVPDPLTRQELCMYSCSLSLDPNTAFENLLLSEENTKVTWTKKAQEYPYHTERFTKYDQVLCSEGLSGVCYWEVEWKGPRVEMAVCYKGPNMRESCFGYNDQSWSVSLANSRCTFWHNEMIIKIPNPCSSRMGLYLNHKAGILSFYSVSCSEQLVLLHKVQTTFSQPLYAGFMVSKGASVKIIKQLQACLI
ncbi:tripartite motif-containing protein 16-like [Poeciliopsis prolifica]|uniref:tripartite motif-containing protein 16-like n=1 Tax=Poeciliopsis prolifica TaxID=188132 RepID=UPI00241399E3|nr:tripartite motif-containing protein 16-like [Poeciliopsis prolifica]XP_054893767.1 tripartite motif-containing protein 16-like [Poeciliopsis prolifica]XP_054893845.1 tripartite motif-containing protein 16-like [Poeciliopsis prolifica]